MRADCSLVIGVMLILTFTMKSMASQVFEVLLNSIDIIINIHKEVELGKSAVGTTKKGIGPTYSSRADRSGAMLADIFNDELLETKLRRMADGYRKRYGDLLSGYDVEEEITRFKTYRAKLADLVIDEVPLIRSAKSKGLKMVVEGAQAAGLDITFGVSISTRFSDRSNLIQDLSFCHFFKLLRWWHTGRCQYWLEFYQRGSRCCKSLCYPCWQRTIPYRAIQ
jgi:hypothetical protein